MHACRKDTFYSRGELNEAIAELNRKHNNTPFQRLDTTREKLFLEVEKDELKPLPKERYEFKNFCYPTVVRIIFLTDTEYFFNGH